MSVINKAMSVPSWYEDQHVLITGATGFMGKILVEKLLRCCPKISKIYLLVRVKRGKEPQERLEEFLKSPVFQTIRGYPDYLNFFKKLQCIPGDLLQDDLSISRNDLKILEENVTLVFHMAANVRFDQTLKSALLTNTGGTLKVLNLVQNFSKLKAFVHVSTAYCHCDQTELEEIFYESPHDPRKLLDLATWMDEDLLAHLTPKLLKKKAPNTYAYTKCLTEQLVEEFSRKLPIAIVRPSIVTAAWKEPTPGWIDNLNGPTGILVGAGKGVIRSMHCKPDYLADIMPVDVCINAIILTAFQMGTEPKISKPFVVNVTASHDNPLSWGNAIELGRKHVYKYPFSLCLWYPGGSIKSNYFVHWCAALFFHTIPSYFVDCLLYVCGYKPFLVKVQQRIGNGLEVFQYYTTRRWMFHNDKIKKIDGSLNEKDRTDFYTNMEKLDWNDYLLRYILGARKYCVHEDLDTLPRARKILQRLYYLDVGKNIAIGLLFLWFAFTFFFA